MGNTKGKTEFFQYLDGLPAKPGFIPKLKGMAE